MPTSPERPVLVSATCVMVGSQWTVTGCTVSVNLPPQATVQRVRRAYRFMVSSLHGSLAQSNGFVNKNNHPTSGVIEVLMFYFRSVGLTLTNVVIRRLPSKRKRFFSVKCILPATAENKVSL